ncbi:hypothetical protein DXG03_005620 [Asterophora parasitica]|uniref:PNPLA domain-containing protein n=1 Tax=Asterophora parasitica TaxID=117018 RepID=A0A9P7KDS9_9AGAR|nr:hypothetical protein DXG03_005620 [Asterophora parasitica]
MNPDTAPNGLKRVLIIDGGGFRGLGSLLVLQEIMLAAESRARQRLLPCDVFDLICGTSTGGLIAVLLGRLGLDCTAAIEIYKQLTISICGTEETAFWERLLKALDTGLEPGPFEQQLASAIEKHSGAKDAPIVPLIRDVLDHSDTNSFVTVTSEKPFFNNKTYLIRSYTALSHPPPPSDHQWLIREAVRGTLASNLFLPPLDVTSSYSFGDAAFAGFSSPIELLVQETQRLWPNDKIGIIASLGPGLSRLAPSNPRREWAATDSYAKKFAEKIMSKLSTTANEHLRPNALNLVKKFVTLAVDTEIAHSAFVATRDTCIRIDPPLGIDTVDFADCFHFDLVEKTVKRWLRDEGKEYVLKVANSLVELNKKPVSADDARFVLPPRQSPTTVNPGYNPRLDERRPETMMDYLK